ncbi:hypothetical protein PINS_up024313 [Pythium insidiosum]|nr:hypothetical protein PINS_up024313 [Pythium insidiosum]
MFEWAGIGFSKGETFRLSVALNRLAVVNGTTSLRFWGKILGVGADFYIAEGEIPGAADPEDPMAEEGTTGVNRFTYWAMKDDGAYEWVRLPNVRREHIHVARQLRRFVRANLDGKVRGRLVVLSSSSCHSSHTRGPSQVPGHPPFPGTERHFLRAQIARIAAGTVIAPSGFFQGERGRRDRGRRGAGEPVGRAARRPRQLGALLQGDQRKVRAHDTHATADQRRRRRSAVGRRGVRATAQVARRRHSGGLASRPVPSDACAGGPARSQWCEVSCGLAQ